jgi:indolepyruvate ferredoxin oxidoreductase, beta subunit
MQTANVFLCGVGGQGIGLLSEVLIHACLASGYAVMGCDTHGLAQRGGVVESHIRIGQKVFTPLVPAGRADVVLALERIEALRAATRMLARGGTLIYYDVEYQPTGVRTGRVPLPEPDAISKVVAARDGRLEAVRVKDIPNGKMQNVALLARLSKLGLIEGLSPEVMGHSLAEHVPERMAEANLAFFHRVVSA